MSIKNALLIASVAVCLALVYQWGTHLSQQAIDMTIGMVCGVAATIPVSLGLVAALLRERNSGEDEVYNGVLSSGRQPGDYADQNTRQLYPQVIVVAPANQPSNPYGNPLPQGYIQTPPFARDFKIVGGEDDETS